jgi:dihydroorotase
VSTARAIELVRQAKARGIHVTCEATPHHLTLTEDCVLASGTAAKVNPPLRTQADVDAVIAGLNEGTIDIIATDHAPHTDAEKALDMDKAPSGISGFETALGSLMGLVHSGRVELSTIIMKLTTEPAHLLGGRFGRIGSLTTGSVADLTIFNPGREWTVEPSMFASKGHNTPLAGARLKGKIMATIVAGQLVYSFATLSCEHKEGVIKAG